MERPPGEEGAGSAPEEQPPATDPTGGPGSGVPPAGPGAASEALAVLTSFGRRLLVLVPVYLAGAAGLSVGFVLFGLALYLGWRRVRDGKERSLRAARQLLDDEERITARTLYMSHRELPAWVPAETQPCEHCPAPGNDPPQSPSSLKPAGLRGGQGEGGCCWEERGYCGWPPFGFCCSSRCALYSHPGRPHPFPDCGHPSLACSTDPGPITVPCLLG